MYLFEYTDWWVYFSAASKLISSSSQLFFFPSVVWKVKPWGQATDTEVVDRNLEEMPD